jgi:hypothetical protein
MHDARAFLQRRMLRKYGLDARFITAEDETQPRMALERQRRPCHDNVRAVIPTHRVESYSFGTRHQIVGSCAFGAPQPAPSLLRLGIRY